MGEDAGFQSKTFRVKTVYPVNVENIDTDNNKYIIVSTCIIIELNADSKSEHQLDKTLDSIASTVWNNSKITLKTTYHLNGNVIRREIDNTKAQISHTQSFMATYPATPILVVKEVPQLPQFPSPTLRGTIPGGFNLNSSKPATTSRECSKSRRKRRKRNGGNSRQKKG